jgi:hypothetical protein
MAPYVKRHLNVQKVLQTRTDENTEQLLIQVYMNLENIEQETMKTCANSVFFISPIKFRSVIKYFMS